MSTINAVLFDYGLVLTGPPDPAAWERMKHVLQADEADFHTAYWKYRHDYDRGTLNHHAYWRRLAADVGSVLDDQKLAALVDDDTALWTQPNQPMIDWAKALQSAGMKTGILSNIGDAMEAGIMERCPWLRDFTHRTFSHRLKIAKPELAIYLHAAAGLDESPAEILFIDDRAENIATARETGMYAVQYTDHAQFLPTLREAGFGQLPGLPIDQSFLTK